MKKKGCDPRAQRHKVAQAQGPAAFPRADAGNKVIKSRKILRKVGGSVGHVFCAAVNYFLHFPGVVPGPNALAPILNDDKRTHPLGPVRNCSHFLDLAGNNGYIN